MIAETAAKVIYNASGGSAPFDEHSGWRMAPRLRTLVDQIGEPEFEESAWHVLTDIVVAEKNNAEAIS